MKRTKIYNALLALGLMLASSAYAQTTQFDVLVDIQGDCTISATDMNFGTVNFKANLTTVNAQSNVTINCPAGVTPVIEYDGGLNRVSGIRRMVQTVATVDYYVDYRLYTDATRTNEIIASSWWPTYPGAATATGNDETIPIYGTIPAQNYPGQLGVYRDTVQVRISY